MSYRRLTSRRPPVINSSATITTCADDILLVRIAGEFDGLHHKAVSPSVSTQTNTTPTTKRMVIPFARRFARWMSIKMIYALLVLLAIATLLFVVEVAFISTCHFTGSALRYMNTESSSAYHRDGRLLGGMTAQNLYRGGGGKNANIQQPPTNVISSLWSWMNNNDATPAVTAHTHPHVITQLIQWHIMSCSAAYSGHYTSTETNLLFMWWAHIKQVIGGIFTYMTDCQDTPVTIPTTTPSSREEQDIAIAPVNQPSADATATETVTGTADLRYTYIPQHLVRNKNVAIYGAAARRPPV